MYAFCNLMAQNKEICHTVYIFCQQGCDPLLSTARGKLQKRRSKLNDEINRELRMRNGAENLFR